MIPASRVRVCDRSTKLDFLSSSLGNYTTYRPYSIYQSLTGMYYDHRNLKSSAMTNTIKNLISDPLSCAWINVQGIDKSSCD